MPGRRRLRRRLWDVRERLLGAPLYAQAAQAAWELRGRLAVALTRAGDRVAAALVGGPDVLAVEAAGRDATAGPTAEDAALTLLGNLPLRLGILRAAAAAGATDRVLEEVREIAAEINLLTAYLQSIASETVAAGRTVSPEALVAIMTPLLTPEQLN